MAENTAFTERAIRKIEPRSIEEPFVEAITDYLFRMGRMAWDDARALFLVECPARGWIVAVWMMPVALKLEPAT